MARDSRSEPEYLVPHLLQARARRIPTKQALVAGEQRLSYAQVDELSNRLANALRSAGLCRGDRVAIFLKKSVDEIVSIFAISKAGGVFVPINRLLFPRQVEHILKDCQVKGIITDAASIEQLKEVLATTRSLEFVVTRGAASCPNASWNHLNLDTLESEYGAEKASATCVSSDLAAIIYTSGSTGRPKGVMISHGNLLASTGLGSSYFGNHAEDRILSVLPFNFDYGLFQLLSAFLHGASLILASFRFPVEIVQTLLEQRITGLGGVPTFWNLLTQPRSPLHRHQFPHLRYITNSGAAMPVSVLEKLRAALPTTEIYLMYGFTEAFRSTYLPPKELDRRPTSIGKALPDMELHVVNEQGEPCKPNEIGELVHRGPTVALGYWGQPEATDRVFRPNPFAPANIVSTERVCYSGDLVKADEEGFLYFIGRRDLQIKSSGYRIGPSEIEEVLYASGKVKEAAVIGVPDKVLGQAIKAFVSPRDQESIDVDDLFDFCSEQLPSYMIPHHIEICSELPKTGSGKIDYPTLQRITAGASPDAHDHG